MLVNLAILLQLAKRPNYRTQQALQYSQHTIHTEVVSKLGCLPLLSNGRVRSIMFGMHVKQCPSANPSRPRGTPPPHMET